MTPEEAVEKALLYTFQLSDKDYRKMQTFRSEIAFIEALAQDGYIIVEKSQANEAKILLEEYEELVQDFHAAAYDDPDMGTVQWERKLDAKWASVSARFTDWKKEKGKSA